MIADSTVAFRPARWYPLFSALVRHRHVVELDATARAVADGRRLVRGLVERWRLPLAAEREQELVLMTSELLTNAVVHAGAAGQVALEARWRGGRLRVEVADGDRRPPVTRAPSADLPHGRGLLLVDQLAADWGWRPTRRGKRVWFEVRP